MTTTTEKLAAALRDALTIVQDLANAWPVHELHKHPDVFNSEAVEALTEYDAAQQPAEYDAAPTGKLADALRRIRDARDSMAEHGEYPLPPNGPGADQVFDDWAADVADAALADYNPATLITLHPTDGHTAEPWRSSDDGKYILPPDDGGVVCSMNPGRNWLRPEMLANARRIVACVNACAGIPTEQLLERAR